MLLGDGFGGFGGIAKFNRDFLEALDASPVVERVHALPRLISEPIVEPIPESVVYDRKAARGKLSFVGRAMARGGVDDRIDLVVCGHLHLLPVAWSLARARRAVLTLIIHGIDAWTPSKSVLANQLARSADQVISVSRYSATRFTAWAGVSIDKVSILPNCVDLERFMPAPRDLELVRRYGLEDCLVLLTVGRLASEEKYKGFDEVIGVLPQLLRRFPNVKYLIVGDGPDRKRLAAKAAKTGVGNAVVFAGRIPESEKVAHYNLADLYVMPSSGEGFGIVLIEAAACGVPIVGSRADGSKEALLDGELGRLVNPGEPRELIEDTTSILDEQPRHLRLSRIETFSVQSFRKRVAAWTEMMCGS